jgi:hypothetical protein
MHGPVGKCIDAVREEITHVLQGGFIAGEANAWSHYSGVQDLLIALDVCHDAFGVDMVALNLFMHFWPERVEKLGVEWNCLPEWQIKREDGQFFCHETTEPLRAIHVSSPNRGSDHYKYQKYFPEEFQKWRNLLG